ncbi:MAG: hypothetical protein ACRDPM_04930 [Solirubrobacteraceae bacterium]
MTEPQEPTGPAEEQGAPVTGTSPYSTGGGVTFERKVAVQYLTHLLVGGSAVELGDGRSVMSVAFQQTPEHSVDDLVIHAARADEVEPSLVLAVGVRRSPDIVQSDESTRKLIRAFVHEAINVPVDGPEHRVALVVAGTQDHAQQLALLADLSSVQMGAESFFELVRTPRKFPAAVRGRLDQIEALVRLALIDLGVPDLCAELVRECTWQILSRLTVLMPRLETPEKADWAAVMNALIPVARGADLDGAARLRDRLVALADEYPPKAATIDRSLLRRDVHQVLDTTTRRHQQGWRALDHLHARAVASVRGNITSADGIRTVQVDRSDAAAELLAAVSSNVAVVVHGESGVGKSALVLRTATSAVSLNFDTTQALCINLRHLPPTTLALEAVLGVPLAALLAELSAPQRFLVIDSADAIAEGMLEPLRYLIDSARQSDVAIVAVTAKDTKQLLHDAIAERCSHHVAEYQVPALTDAQVDELVATFQELAALATNPRSRELLRRPVVADLLVRGGLSGLPLSDADAMRQVWSGLVRRQEQTDRGTPDAREIALLRLADLALSGSSALDVVGAIDSAALDGLRRDGLLRTSVVDPFKIGPEFAHDEVRRYAVARLMLAAGDPTSNLVDAGVPRWALGAARLACQAVLAAPNTTSNPLRGRFSRLQQAFGDLVDAGHGDRWGDVPGEALLTLGDPEPLLRDAWSALRAEQGAGLQRLSRLVDQRLRGENGFVSVVAIEPLITLLLDNETPWRGGEHVQDRLRDWLRALVIADTPEGYPLRVRLRDRLVIACAAADRRLKEEQEAAAAARAARSPEGIEEDRQFRENHRALFTEIGYPRSQRRQRPALPREIIDKVMVELLALLGPDLGHDGETVLHRVAEDAPSRLGPAVEEPFTGRALAMYRRGFLAELTEAYYLDDEQDGSGFHEDGIRHHHARGFGVTPLAAWYRGPFMALFQSDFRNGVAVLNRMLNHAALARARTLAGHYRYGAPVDDRELDAYRTAFNITGARRIYIGDEHVWIWYRGTGVGPYPCMSALQALERVCDQLVEIGIPVANVVATLLTGCENLAMIGLIVGLLVRHLENADRLLDFYLAEPMIWDLEFMRIVHESGGLAAPSDGLVALERRTWSLREAAMLLVLRADGVRVDELRMIGEQLVETTRQLVQEALGDVDDGAIEQQLVTVRAWASGLDRGTYEAHQAEGRVYIESKPPDEIVQAMQTWTAEVQRGQEATRLFVRYFVQPKKGPATPVGAEELVTDLAVAQELLERPPSLNASDQWDIPAAVAAAALEAHLIRGVDLPEDALRFAVDTVLRVGVGEAPPPTFESEESFFERGGNRSAARVLPLLLSPSAAALRALVDGEAGSDTYTRASAAASNLACAVAHEVRMHLARGLDRLWVVPCSTEETCHHQPALQLAITTMRDCAFGDWDPVDGRRQVVMLDDPVEQSLTDTASDAIYVARLDAAIRALAPAAMASVCVSERARDLLAVFIAAHRRSLLAYEDDMDSRGTHALNAARALLTIAADGDDTPIFRHIDAYADNATLLSSFLRVLSAAAEESTDRAATARCVWPSIVSHVISLEESEHIPFHCQRDGDYALAALMPNPAGEVSYLYHEVANDPIVWWAPLTWQPTVEQWLPLARGNPTCIDHLVIFLAVLAPEDQARIGLPWVANLALASPTSVANRSFMLTPWLIEIRSSASGIGLEADWQRVVDALVVAGVTRLASYSE